MLLVLDNYDSFTFNLVQYLGELGTDPTVVRNDRITVAGAIALRPSAIVVSPGPGTPGQAGIAVDLIRVAAAARIPLLGVCLGHQAIAEAFGGQVIRAMRYHSLIVAAESLPAELAVTAWSGDRAPGEEIMAMRHKTLPVWGVQFHPESAGTTAGKQLLINFLSLAGIARGER